MGMDMLRSHNLTRTRVLSDSGEEFWLRWYPAATTALSYPNWHAFGHPAWEEDEEDQFEGPGTFHEPLEWRGKTYPAPPGLHWHGLPEWFEHGLPSAQLAGGLPLDICGTPTQFGAGTVEPNGAGDITGEGGQVMLVVEKTTLVGSGGDVPLGDGTCYRIDTTGVQFISGFAGGLNGRLICIGNVGTGILILLNEDPGSIPVNRIRTFDLPGLRIYPAMEAWGQYDGTSQRWRFYSHLPIVKEKGDLITHTLTTPVRLPVSINPEHVLRANPDADPGMEWGPVPTGPGSGTPDLHFWRHANSTQRYIAGYVTAATFSTKGVTGVRLYAMPLVTPRAMTIAAMEVSTPTAAVGKLCRVGIYRNTSSTNLVPSELLADVGEIDLDSTPPQTIAAGVGLDGGQLYWVAFVLNESTTMLAVENLQALVLLGMVLEPDGTWSGFNGIGWAVGLDEYPDQLPATFPAGAQIVPNADFGPGHVTATDLPAVAVTFSG